MRRVLRVSKPCSLLRAPFDHESGQRYCAHCNKAVHLLDGLNGKQVRDLLRANPGGFCGAYTPGPDGEFVVPPITARMSPGRLAVASTLLASTLSACTEKPSGAPSSSAPPAALPRTANLQGHESPQPMTASPSPSPLRLSAEQRAALSVLGYIAP